MAKGNCGNRITKSPRVEVLTGLDAMAAAVADDDDPGYTVKEIAERAGITRSAAGGRVRGLLIKGACVQGWNTRLDETGRPQRVPVYRLKDSP